MTRKEKRAAARRKKVAELKAAGLCISCSKPLDRKGWHCEACAKKRREYAQMRRDICREVGLTCRGQVPVRNLKLTSEEAMSNRSPFSRIAKANYVSTKFVKKYTHRRNRKRVKQAVDMEDHLDKRIDVGMYSWG